MNTDYTPSSQGKSFIPLCLICVSIIAFFGWQWKDIAERRAKISSDKSKFEDNVNMYKPKLEDQAGKAVQFENVLKKLVVELIEVAKTDKDAQAIVAKAGIQQQANPNAGGTAAPAPAPAPGTP